jgi:hypothetical protein
MMMTIQLWVVLFSAVRCNCVACNWPPGSSVCNYKIILTTADSKGATATATATNITTIRTTTALLQPQTTSLPLQPKQIYSYYTRYTQLGVIMQLKTLLELCTFTC